MSTNELSKECQALRPDAEITLPHKSHKATRVRYLEQLGCLLSQSRLIPIGILEKVDHLGISMGWEMLPIRELQQECLEKGLRDDGDETITKECRNHLTLIRVFLRSV